MLDHLSTGTRSLDRARKFYDACLQPLGYRCLSRDAGSVGYGADTIAFWVLVVPSPVAADGDSGLHVCFRAPTRDSVDAFHAKALKAGGRDNGRPGIRKDYGEGYYAGFVTDPDGYHIEAYCAAN